jgi:type IV secretory pathway TrbL component
MVVLFIFFIVLSPLFVIGIHFVGSFGATSPQAHMISALINGVWEAVSGAAMAIYAVVVYRTLINEQKV